LFLSQCYTMDPTWRKQANVHKISSFMILDDKTHMSRKANIIWRMSFSFTSCELSYPTRWSFCFLLHPQVPTQVALLEVTWVSKFLHQKAGSRYFCTVTVFWVVFRTFYKSRTKLTCYWPKIILDIGFLNGCSLCTCRRTPNLWLAWIRKMVRCFLIIKPWYSEAISACCLSARINPWSGLT
jgi:hypothetical protein